MSPATATRRKRRTPSEIESLCTAMYELLEAEQPATVRQVYYRLVSRGLIQKTEGEYNRTVCRLLSVMRREGRLPYRWLADATRWMRKPTTYHSAREMLERTAGLYRQSIWSDQHAYVEIWLEKDALAGVLWSITAKWDVPLMVCRGYPSLSFLSAAAEVISKQRRPCYLYYLGDHDPSGVDIPRKIESDLRDFAPAADLHFERVAVRPDQIEAWSLPTRPTKRSDSRCKHFTGESVEVDAIEPAQLRTLVAGCIERHVDQRVLQQTKVIESAERETLQRVLAGLGEAA